MKKFLLLIAGCLGCFAQVQNTIYQNLAMNSTVAMPRLLGPLTNIGQSTHQFILQLNNNGGNTCLIGTTMSIPIAAVVGSYVPITSYNQSQRLLSTSIFDDGALDPSAPPYTFTIQAQGAYPYVFLYLDSFDTTNCTYTVNYSGTLYPFPQYEITWNSTNITASQDTLGTSTIFAAHSYEGLGIYFNTLTVSNNTAGQTVTISCTAPTQTLYVFSNMQAGQTVVIPYDTHAIGAGGCRSEGGITLSTSINGYVQITATLVIRLQDNF